MPPFRSVALLCLLLASTAGPVVSAQTAARHKATPIVDQVLKLLQAKLPESVILKKIQENGTPVDPSTDQLIALKQAGATDAILSALQDPKSVSVATSAKVTPAAAPAAELAAPATIDTTTTTTTTVSRPEVKKRVAVDQFDYSTVKTSVAAIFGTNQDIGKGIESMFVTRLASDGKVVIVERQKVQKILAEQDLAASNRAKQGTGARVGQIRGADAILYGDIVVFGRDDHHDSASTAGRAGGLFGMGAAALAAAGKKDKAVVAIDYRLVDAETSEVIATGEARGESTRKSSSFSGDIAAASGLKQGTAQGAVDMNSTNFAETIIGEATMDCVNKLAAAIDEQLPKLGSKQMDISARIAFVSGNNLTINAGSAQGVAVGDQFEVAHVLNEVKDPSTGEVIDLATQKLGVLHVVQVKDRVAIGSYQGSGTPKVGDVAEKH